MSPIWILSYIVVTVLSSGRMTYEPQSVETTLKPCFETMWQLDEVTVDTFGKDGKVNGGYKKFIELSCKLKDFD